MERNLQKKRILSHILVCYLCIEKQSKKYKIRSFGKMCLKQKNWMSKSRLFKHRIQILEIIKIRFKNLCYLVRSITKKETKSTKRLEANGMQWSLVSVAKGNQLCYPKFQSCLPINSVLQVLIPHTLSVVKVMPLLLLV